MRRTIFIAIVALIFSAPVSSQVVIKNPLPGIKVSFQRCVQEQGVAYIDLLITNNSEKDCGFKFDKIYIYDNNCGAYSNAEYRSDLKYPVYIAKTDSFAEASGDRFKIPAGVPYKTRVVVRNGFDDKAKTVALLKIEFIWNVFGAKEVGLWEGEAFELRNIEIDWED